MTRMGKKEKRRHLNPKKRQVKLTEKSGPKKDHLENGFKYHENALTEQHAQRAFIPKIK